MSARDREALERVASGHPDLMRALWGNFPSPYEIDLGDEEVLKRLLAAIAAAAGAH